MTPRNDSLGAVLLDDATRRLRDVQVPPLPPHLIDTTMAAIESEPVFASSPRGIGNRLLQWSAIAASLVVALSVAAALLVNSGNHVAFAQVVDNAKKAESVEFVLIPGRVEAEEREQKCAFHGKRVRTEYPSGIVWLADASAMESLYLDAKHRTAGRFKLQADVAKEILERNPIEQLRHVRTEDAEELGKAVVDGKDAVIFRVRGIELFELKTDEGEMRVWVDSASLLPVRIELRFDEKTFVIIKKIKWNSVIDPALMRMEVPQGYAEQSLEDFKKLLAPRTNPGKTRTASEAFREWIGESE
jgi:hypothetical protein